MSARRSFIPALVLVAAALAAGATGASARSYPTNACVAAKQKQAARYCRKALGAWATWESRQDAAKRDARLAKAADALGAGWSEAEAESAAHGVDCADTTLAAGAAVDLLDSAIGAIVADVNDGLSLGERSQARCGAKALQAAAKKCRALLMAESRFVKAPAKDTTGAARTKARNEARDIFARKWAKAVAGSCPTTATEAGVEAAVDAAVAAVVRDTTVSPNVDDAQYTTISPVGTTEYLGKALTPVCMDGSPYHYFVKRGTVNKLVMYYQGGGACWEQLTCSVPACDPNVNPAGGDNPNNGTPRGFADLSNPNNPFRDWNAVFVSYCSCDIHFGDAAQDYTNFDPNNPKHVEHRGFHNAQIAEKWAREHFVSPEEVFVTGSSAGAYGAWFNAPLLHDVWPAAQFHVLADAGNGVITQDFLTSYFPNWNFSANLPSDIPGLEELITSGAGIPAYTELIANHFPATTWAHYSSAYDGGSGGQTGFYNVMLHDNDPLAALTWWEGSCAFNPQMRAQAIATAAAVPSNYRYYIGTGSRHTMWGSNKVYADTTGGVPLLVDWVNAMLGSGHGSADPAWTNVECSNCGLLLPGDPRPNPLQPPFTQVGSDVVIQCSSPSGAFLD